MSDDPLGDPYLANKKIGQCDLIYGHNDSKCSPLKYNVLDTATCFFQFFVNAGGFAHNLQTP